MATDVARCIMLGSHYIISSESHRPSTHFCNAMASSTSLAICSRPDRRSDRRGQACHSRLGGSGIRDTSRREMHRLKLSALCEQSLES